MLAIRESDLCRSLGYLPVTLADTKGGHGSSNFYSNTFPNELQ